LFSFGNALLLGTPVALPVPPWGLLLPGGGKQAGRISISSPDQETCLLQTVVNRDYFQLLLLNVGKNKEFQKGYLQQLTILFAGFLPGSVPE
jgi:hypothetical protein